MKSQRDDARLGDSRAKLEESLAFFDLTMPSLIDAGLNVGQAIDRISEWMLAEAAPENHDFIRSRIAAMRGPFTLGARLQSGPSMQQSRAEIEAALLTFEDSLPALCNSFEPPAIDSISRLTEVLISSATPPDLEFVRDRVQVLVGSGEAMPPGHDEKPGM